MVRVAACGTAPYIGRVIVTFTPNPSLDRTAQLHGAIAVGGLNRLSAITAEAGGKGVNLSLALHLANVPTLAILPADADDPVARSIKRLGVPANLVPVGRPARTNLTVVQPGGVATKFNEPGLPLTPENVTACVSAVMAACPRSSWLALCGSLPPGAPVNWYQRFIDTARQVGVPVAVDTSGIALRRLVEDLPRHAPDVMTPNVAELREATGHPLAHDDVDGVVAVARELTERGVGAMLVTLGAMGAVLVTREEAWYAASHDVEVASTVGAGDATLAGYLLAARAGLPVPERLARAVAYGTACVTLPGSRLPRPEEAAAFAITPVRL